MIAFEYGWTFDHIASLSNREIWIALENINRRRHNEKAGEMNFQAALHGKKLNLPLIQTSSRPQKMDLEKESRMERARIDALKRKQREIKRG